MPTPDPHPDPPNNDTVHMGPSLIERLQFHNHQVTNLSRVLKLTH